METLPTRIGVLVPSLDPVVEHDLQRFLPAGGIVSTLGAYPSHLRVRLRPMKG